MMNIILYLLVTDFIFFVNSGADNYKFVPTLPVGEYQAVFKAIINCNTNLNSLIQPNFYLSRVAENTYAQKGNLTLKQPFDDSLTLHINMAIKDSIGGWKDNAHVYRCPKACSAIKAFIGSEWEPFMKSIGLVNTQDCPLPPGVHVSNYYDISRVKYMNYTKIFFYGSYNFRLYFTDKYNNKQGCLSYIMDIKRPWEA